MKKPQNPLHRAVGKTQTKVFTHLKVKTYQRVSSYVSTAKKEPKFISSSLAKFVAFALVGIIVSMVSPYIQSKVANRDVASVSKAAASGSVDVWWPTDQVKVNGTVPLKALLSGSDINSYSMFWQVDGGTLNPMATSYQDYPHKESLVDVSGWNWKGNGPYVLNFVAKDASGAVLGQIPRTIYIDRPSGTTTTTTTIPVTTVVSPTTSTTATPAATQPSCDQVGQNVFIGCYYGSKDFTNLKFTRTDNQINFDWGGGSPDSRIGNDNFSVIWQGTFSFDTAAYAFSATADDGIRVSVDGNPIISKLIDQAATTYTAQANMAAGNHTVKVEYYESAGGAVAKVGWSKATAASPIVVQPISTPVSNSANPLAGANFYNNPNSNAKAQADAWKYSYPYGASLMTKLAAVPNAFWFGGWNSNVQSDAANVVNAAQAAGAVPVMVAYNIPGRDCGGYSSGGAQTADAYKSWIRQLAAGIGSKRAAVVLEPDALAGLDCLSGADQQTRLSLLRDAVSVLKANSGTAVYIDAGNSHWIDAATMAGRLTSVGISSADGFALNMSNFLTTSDNTNYGTQVSAKVGGKHFIIDTSRNGNGPTVDYQWCNPSGRAVGITPTTNTGNALVDALIWGKDPGGSDGQCNGGPSAGTWWADYAVQLMKNAGW